MIFIVEHSVPRSSKDSIAENSNLLDSGGEFGEEMEPQYGEYVEENPNGEENIIIDITEYPTETDSNSDITKTPNRSEIKANVLRKQKKRKRINEDDILTTASETMQHLAKAFSSNKEVNANGLQAFAEFITTKLQIMVDDPDLLDETEEDIANLIFTNLKRYREKKKSQFLKYIYLPV
ncbi:uncharacterized protein LOC111691337 [Anoplophora glabripennis]|uniref:uncharacterized protein LOC111691337 n=1 Tax=Anoplophora glabripennis TaxID=217634 RepID=UPI000C75F054|nr:uncharacterized protein LOC111691337 [Anoplophora glabripennis]